MERVRVCIAVHAPEARLDARSVHRVWRVIIRYHFFEPQPDGVATIFPIDLLSFPTHCHRTLHCMCWWKKRRSTSEKRNWHGLPGREEGPCSFLILIIWITRRRNASWENIPWRSIAISWNMFGRNTRTNIGTRCQGTWRDFGTQKWLDKRWLLLDTMRANDGS